MKQRIFKNSRHAADSMLLKDIHIIFELPFVGLFHLGRFLDLMYDLVPGIIVIHLDSVNLDFLISRRPLRITRFVNQPAFINQVRFLLHIYTGGKKPKFPPADMVIIELCASYFHCMDSRKAPLDLILVIE